MQFNKSSIWIFEKLFAVVFLSIFCTFFTYKRMMTVHAETHYTAELAKKNVGFDPETGRLEIPYGFTEIDDSVFSHRQDIKRVVIPNSVTKIGELAFMDCQSLKEVTLPESLEFIGVMAFDSCTSLEKIVIPDKVKDIDRVFGECESLKEVVLPKGLKNIDTGAFAFCRGLEQVNIPNGVKTIRGSAFLCCALEDITIPGSVNHIGYNAFSCKSLKEVNISDTYLNIKVMDDYKQIYVGQPGTLVIHPKAFQDSKGNINIGNKTFTIDEFINLYSADYPTYHTYWG